VDKGVVLESPEQREWRNTWRGWHGDTD